MNNVSAVGKPAWETVLLVMGFACVAAAVSSASSPQPPYKPVDPVFESGLAALRKNCGITESTTEPQAVAKRDLRVLIGVESADGAKRLLYFVELTTMLASNTNAAGAGSTRLYTNRVSWPGLDSASHGNISFEFVYTLAPLRVRVFDEKARLQKQGQAIVPWELMTNSLADVCRICVAVQTIQAIPEKDKEARKKAIEELIGGSVTNSVDWAKVMRPVAGGVLTLGGLFTECLSTPALSDIREKAQGVIRLPGTWAMLSTALGGKLDLALDPRFLTDASTLKAGGERDAGTLYRFPADLKSGKRKLVSVEFVVGPSNGPHVMLAGIRCIRAVHPTKPGREFVAQVLAAGTAYESD